MHPAVADLQTGQTSPLPPSHIPSFPLYLHSIAGTNSLDSVMGTSTTISPYTSTDRQFQVSGLVQRLLVGIASLLEHIKFRPVRNTINAKNVLGWDGVVDKFVNGNYQAVLKPQACIHVQHSLQTFLVNADRALLRAQP